MAGAGLFRVVQTRVLSRSPGGRSDCPVSSGFGFPADAILDVFHFAEEGCFLWAYSQAEITTRGSSPAAYRKIVPRMCFVHVAVICHVAVRIDPTL